LVRRGVVAAGEDALAVTVRAEARVQVDPAQPLAARAMMAKHLRSVAWLHVGSAPP